MFAPRVATTRRKEMPARPADLDSGHRARPGTSATATMSENRRENLTDLAAPRRIAWDFGKIPLFPPDQASRSQASYPLPGIIQPKLTVGAVNDPLEHEADRVADQVMRMPDPNVSVAAAPPQVAENVRPARRKKEKSGERDAGTAARSLSEAPTSVHEVLHSPGQPLDSATRAYFEPRFGQDFSRVRVHAGAQTTESAGAVMRAPILSGRDWSSPPDGTSAECRGPKAAGPRTHAYYPARAESRHAPATRAGFWRNTQPSYSILWSPEL